MYMKYSAPTLLQVLYSVDCGSEKMVHGRPQRLQFAMKTKY
jgi:hypothetical protein